MRNLVIFMMFAAALSSGLGASIAVAASNQDWINQAMSAARPEKSGDGVRTSGGVAIEGKDFLPEATQKEKELFNKAAGSYGDDAGLIGAASTTNQYLASQGANTSAGQAFEIVNQPIGFETRIEHKIYQHEVLYEHDLQSPLTSTYHQFAWMDHRNQTGSDINGGPNFYTTPIPSGYVRSYTPLLVAPIKYGSCERAQVKLTAGKAWAPGCNRNDAKCERIISNPLSSPFYRWYPSMSLYWRWLDNNGNEIQKAENSTGSVRVSGHGLQFAASSVQDSSESLATLRAKYGVRKIEASGICNHPFPSDDPYYIESLPSCDDPNLRHGQECGKVERKQVNYQNNPFAALDLDSQLNAMMQDCQIITEDTSEEIQYTETELKFCGKTQEAVFPGCTATPRANIKTTKHCGNLPDSGICWNPSYTHEVQSSYWETDQRCRSLMEGVAQMGSACSYTITSPDPQCAVIDGIEVCKGDDNYQKLSPAPGGLGSKHTPVTISDVSCDVFDSGQTVESDGIAMELEPYNSCSVYENDAQCRLIEEVCASEADTPMGSWCAEVDRTYQCETIKTKRSNSEQTKMVCGNQTIYCADGSCVDQADQAASTGFARAAAMLSAVQGIASHTECSDPTRPETCRVFNGEAQACRKGRGKFADLWNCCDISGGSDALDEDNYVEAILNDGAEELFIGPNVALFFDSAKMLLQFFVPCNNQEIELATSKEIDATLYLGSYCGKKISLGFTKVCIRNDRSYCAWPTTLGKVIMTQAKGMVGESFGSAKNPDCRGLTINQLAQLDWSKLDLSDWADKLIETGNLPSADFSDIGNNPSTWTPQSNPGGVGWQ